MTTPVGAQSSLDQYIPNPGSYDELRSMQGQLLPPWKQLAATIERIGISEFTRRWEQATRLLREDDFIFNVPSSEAGAPSEETWSIDPVPMILTPSEWSVIEAGAKQRAAVLNGILNDFYGPQRLVRDGVIPASMLFTNPGFLRACHGMQLNGGTWLHLYAADLVRVPDGRWLVLADRTQAPYGAGYALENRIVLSRTFPDIFHSFEVRRLVTFFRSLQMAFRQLAPHNRDSPRVVLLSPGPNSSNYFEQVYLARYLGVPLVEGADLTARDNCIYLKTIAGLQLVDVVLRHVNDSLCDPLELRYDSLVGVAGLVQAAHSGNVVVMNALGSGIVGSYSMSPYIAEASRYLRGEELRLQSVPALWCGDDDQQAEALSNLRRHVIKGAVSGVTARPIFGCLLDDAELADLTAKIEKRPYDYVAQENVMLSEVASWTPDGFQARPLVLRVYAVWTPTGYQMMPGGLVRLGRRESPTVARTSSYFGSKDAWVLSDQPVTSATLLNHSRRVLALNRYSADQPSRVADNMYWLGRYVERAEGNVRLLRAVINRALEDTANEDMPEFPALLRVLSQVGLMPEDFPTDPALQQDDQLEQELLLGIVDQSRPGSIRSTIDALRRTGWIVRDRLSQDAWRSIHRMDADVAYEPTAITPGDANGILRRLLLPLSAFAGLAMESMTRGFGWRFLDIGRRIERSVHTLTLIKYLMVEEIEGSDAVYTALLEIADSSMTYRYRYLSTMQADAVLDLVLFDPSNPRSVAFQLMALSEHVASLPHDSPKIEPGSPDDIMNRLLEPIRQFEADQIVDLDEDNRRPKLETICDELLTLLPELSNAISSRFFSHTQSVRQIEQVTGWH